MMRHNTDLQFAPTLQTMLDRVKRRYGQHCVITGVHAENLSQNTAGTLDTAHIFARSTYPELRTCLENGLPICRYRHSWPFDKESIGCLDKSYDRSRLGRDRTPVERIQWLVDNLHERFREQAIRQMTKLVLNGSIFSTKIKGSRDQMLEILGAA